MNLLPHPKTYLMAFRFHGRSRADSGQEKIDQRDRGGTDANGNQGIVGGDIAPRIGGGWAGFTRHLANLGGPGAVLCEQRHIWQTLLRLRNGSPDFGLARARTGRRWTKGTGNAPAAEVMVRRK